MWWKAPKQIFTNVDSERSIWNLFPHLPAVQIWQEEWGAQAIPFTHALWLFNLATGVQGTLTSRITTFRNKTTKLIIGIFYFFLQKTRRFELRLWRLSQRVHLASTRCSHGIVSSWSANCVHLKKSQASPGGLVRYENMANELCFPEAAQATN